MVEKLTDTNLQLEEEIATLKETVTDLVRPHPLNVLFMYVYFICVVTVGGYQGLD